MVNIKDKIMDAALQEFLTYGKSGAKTKAIADSAGVNKALIHYYFSNKDLLFLDCVKDILHKMEGTFHTNEVKAISDYRDYIKALISSYTEFVRNHSKHISFLLWEHLNDRELLSEIKSVLGSGHLDDFIDKTKAAIEREEIRELDPLDLYINMVSLILSTYMLLPIALSFIGEDDEYKNQIITKNREAEIARLLWEDIKREKK